MIGVRQEHRRQSVEGQLSVGLGIVDRVVMILAPDRFMVGVMLERPRGANLERVQPHVEPGEDRADGPAPFGDGRLGIADELEFVGDPARAQRRLVGAEDIAAAVGDDRFIGGLRGEHARFHRGMAALDPRHVDEPRRAADQRTAGKGQLRDRLPPALVDRARAIADALAALDLGADRGVSLPPLEFLERRQIGVPVIERGDEAERDLAIVLVVEEAPAPRVVQRPTLGVDHPPRMMLVGRNIPQLLDSKSIDLRAAVFPQVEQAGQFLGQVPARALGEEGVAGVEFHPALIVLPVRAVPGDPHVAGRDPADAPVLGKQDFGGGEPGEDFDPELFGLPRQPAREIAEAGGEGALVVHERRHQQVRQRILALAGQHPVMVLGHRDRQRAALVTPIGDQFVERLGIEHRARQDMRPDLAPFLEHAHADLAIVRGGELLQPDRGGEPGGAGADDDDIIFHRFAVGHSLPHYRARCRRQHSHSLTAPSTFGDGRNA